MPPRAPAPAPGEPASWPTLARDIADCRACARCDQPRMRLPRRAPTQRADWLIVLDNPWELDEPAPEGSSPAQEASALLDRMLQGVLHVQREAPPEAPAAQRAHVTFLTKCKPIPGRQSLGSKAEWRPGLGDCQTCESFLQREIELSQPQIILAMGYQTGRFLAQHDDPPARNLTLAQLRRPSRPLHYRGIALAVTFTPKEVVRAPRLKRDAFEDLKLARARAEGTAG